jgi:hypothetical protein
VNVKAVRPVHILDHCGKPIPSAATRRALAARRAVRGRYNAAVTTDVSRRHWANADRLSADAAASPGVRRILGNRACLSGGA